MEILSRKHLPRRGFWFCCAAAGAATGGWLTPREAFAEARGIVSLIKVGAAVSPIVTHELRSNVSVLEGSGGTIAVLSGPDGKVLVDAGISGSRTQIVKAIADLGAGPITHLINTHWHFDHTDGNTWLNAMGGKIIAQENTLRYLSQVQRVDDWGYNFLALPPGGLPREVFAKGRSLKLNRQTIELKHYGPAHTDSDISVTFAEANVVHVADTFWNGVYPFIDYSTGGSVDGMIAACDTTLAATNVDTIIIARLKRQGRLRDETVAAKPTAPFDAKFRILWSIQASSRNSFMTASESARLSPPVLERRRPRKAAFDIFTLNRKA